MRLPLVPAPLLALAALTQPAVPQGFGLPELGLQTSGACRQLGVRDRASNAMAGIGCVQGSKFYARPEALQLQGSGSTGDASGLCAKLPELGACRSHADRARDVMSVMDAVGVVCDGVHDDAPGIQVALNTAVAFQATVRLPQGKTCGIGQTLNLSRARLHGGGPGSGLKPLAPMTDMVRISTTLSAVKGVNFSNAGNLAGNGIRVETISDALQTVVEDNYFSGFPGYATYHTGGQSLIFTGNACINNGGCFAIMKDGVTDVVASNYSAGGNGFLLGFPANPGVGGEGVTVRDNVVFAPYVTGSYALRITSAIDFKIEDNTFEGCNTVQIDGTDRGVSIIKSARNWYGTNPASDAPNVSYKCAALGLRNQVNGFASVNDAFEGRGQVNVVTSAVSSERANRNVTFQSPYFWDVLPAVLDMSLANVVGLRVSGAFFGGTAPLAEGSTVQGRVDGSIFGATLPTRNALAYGRQTFGMTTVAAGTATIPSGQTSVVVTHGLAYAPIAGDIVLTPVGTPTNAVGSPYISASTATTFTIAVRSDPGTSGWSIGWKADIAR